jgi:hypothetical protein
MQPLPAEHSVLVLNNCQIHNNEAIAKLVQTAGMLQYPLLLTKINIYSGTQMTGTHLHIMLSVWTMQL